MRHPWLHQLFGRSGQFRRLALGLASRLEFALLQGHKDHDTLALIRRIHGERESLMGANEAFTLHSVATAQSRLEGDMAEVGVYQGCSAAIISRAGKGSRLHLFDTFGGLPPPSIGEKAFLQEGQYAADLADVRDYLADHQNVVFHPGEFTATAGVCASSRFSFVHLDVDLKGSTRACLEFFYPRLVAGGIILTHDYSVLDGVRAACSEFLTNRRERMIELSTSQALLVKL